MWRHTDPRDTLYERKRAEIVILRPAASGRGWEAGTAYVEMYQGWCVLTSFENHPVIGEGDRWDPLWQWALGPESSATLPAAK